MSKEKEQPKTVRMPLRLRYKRRIKLALILLAVLLVALIVYFLFNQSRLNARPVCSDQQLEQASTVLDRSKVEELKPIAESIQQLERFDRDPNCLYVVVSYYIYMEDPSNARTFFEKLKKAYIPDQGFSSKLGDRTKTLEDLELEVGFVEKVAQERKDNLRSIPNME